MSFIISLNSNYLQQEAECKVEELLNAEGIYPRRQLVGEMLRKLKSPGIQNTYTPAEIMKIYREMADDKDLIKWNREL